MMEEWNVGILEYWKIVLTGFQGLCAEKPVRSDDVKYECWLVTPEAWSNRFTFGRTDTGCDSLPKLSGQWMRSRQARPDSRPVAQLLYSPKRKQPNLFTFENEIQVVVQAAFVMRSGLIVSQCCPKISAFYENQKRPAHLPSCFRINSQRPEPGG
jgi:hypothetical protein